LKNAPKILSIKSDKTELEKVEDFLSNVFIENKLPLQYFNKVLLCVTEAVINSIDHGNKNDNRKNVYIEVKCYNNDIDVKIKDEGCGFDIDNLDDPTNAKNLKKETGRGIHIIRSLSDEFQFEDKGNCVRFKLKVSE